MRADDASPSVSPATGQDAGRPRIGPRGAQRHRRRAPDDRSRPGGRVVSPGEPHPNPISDPSGYRPLILGRRQPEIGPDEGRDLSLEVRTRAQSHLRIAPVAALVAMWAYLAR